MTSRNNDMPTDDEDILRAWASQPAILQYIRDQGWAVANRRRHDITICARTFANNQFAEQDEQRQGFFEGVAFALLADLRLSDIRTLTQHLTPQPKTTTGHFPEGQIRDSAAGGKETDSISSAKEPTTADGPHDDGGSVPPVV